jgi:hypothetical protein
MYRRQVRLRRKFSVCHNAPTDPLQMNGGGHRAVFVVFYADSGTLLRPRTNWREIRYGVAIGAARTGVGSSVLCGCLPLSRNCRRMRRWLRSTC